MTKQELRAIRKSDKELQELKTAYAETKAAEKRFKEIELFEQKLSREIQRLESAEDNLFDLIINLPKKWHC